MKRIVIKIGTNILTTAKGNLDLNSLRNLVHEIGKALKKSNIEVLIVTSGAITSGSEELNVVAKSIPEKQAAAAVGQILMMNEYSHFFGHHGFKVGQILLTKEAMADTKKQGNIRNTIETLLEKDLIPIINENDSVVTDEIGTQFGDNDRLSCELAKLIRADKLIILTDTDGVYTHNPKTNPKAKLIRTLEKSTQSLIESADEYESHRNRGGMKAKILAAIDASENAIDVTIANGRTENVISDIFKGKQVGTRFKAVSKSMG